VLECYRHCLDIDFDSYLKKIIKLLDEVTICEGEQIDIRYDEKTGVVKTAIVSITRGAMADVGNFSVKFHEKSVANNAGTELKRFCYQILNENNTTDFIRFDLDFREAEKGFVPLHANADSRKWGKEHLVFPKDINLDLKKLDLSKAYYIFLHYIYHPDEHPYDKSKNSWYKKQLNN